MVLHAIEVAGLLAQSLFTTISHRLDEWEHLQGRCGCVDGGAWNQV
jgi:hypothetical protein